MAYNKKTWESDEIITQEALNNMEDGIAAAHTAIAATNTNLAGKQDALTPGSGITITDNIISIGAAHASGTETPAQQKPATVGKVQELIGGGRRVVPVTSAPATLDQTVIYLVHGSSNVTIGTVSVPAGTTACVYYNGNDWVAVEDDSDESLETLKKLSYGGQSYLFAKGNYDFILNSSRAADRADKDMQGFKTVTEFGSGVISFSYGNTAPEPSLFGNRICIDSGGSITLASDTNTWNAGDTFLARVEDVEIEGVSGVKTILTKITSAKRGYLDVSGNTVSVNITPDGGSHTSLVVGPLDIKDGAVYSIETHQYNGLRPTIVSVDANDNVVDNTKTTHIGAYTFGISAKKFYVYCYNIGKNNNFEIKEVITYGGDPNRKSIENIEGKVQTMEMFNPWKGKKALAFGASGTYGMTSVNYPDTVARMLGINMTNRAGSPRNYYTQFNTDGGVHLMGLSTDEEEKTDPLAKTWVDYFTSDLDLVIFGGGDTDCITNNGEADKTLINNLVFPLAEGQHFTYSDGTTLKEHRDTYIGAIIYLLDKLWTISPKCRVVFVEDYFFIGSAGDAPKSGKSVEITNLLCQKLHIPCINVHEKVGWNWYNKGEYMVDGMHPNEEGTRKIATMIANELLLIA